MLRPEAWKTPKTIISSVSSKLFSSFRVSARKEKFESAKSIQNLNAR
jgi:hypothetical protein